MQYSLTHTDIEKLTRPVTAGDSMPLLLAKVLATTTAPRATARASRILRGSVTYTDYFDLVFTSASFPGIHPDAGNLTAGQLDFTDAGGAVLYSTAVSPMDVFNSGAIMGATSATYRRTSSGDWRLRIFVSSGTVDLSIGGVACATVTDGSSSIAISSTPNSGGAAAADILSFTGGMLRLGLLENATGTTDVARFSLDDGTTWNRISLEEFSSQMVYVGPTILVKPGWQCTLVATADLLPTGVFNVSDGNNQLPD